MCCRVFCWLWLLVIYQISSWLETLFLIYYCPMYKLRKAIYKCHNRNVNGGVLILHRSFCELVTRMPAEDSVDSMLIEGSLPPSLSLIHI